MAEILKERYNPAYIQTLVTSISEHFADFDAADFTRTIFDDQWEGRELKDRMTHIAHSLRAHLPKDYRDTLEILNQAAPNFGGFEGMFFPEIVALYGLDDWDASIAALGWLTRFSSSEFAVRPFIKKDPKRMMAQMSAWAEDENYHVRRLASEGCRPRLPWAMALPDFKRDPSPILPILEKLKQDPEEYVRRSVANNLNDIAKDHPQLVLKTARQWLGLGSDTDRLVKHACRTLLKAGLPEAMILFGFGDPSKASVSDFRLQQVPVEIGKAMSFSFTIQAPKKSKIRLEYAITFQKKQGKTGRKVFKISEIVSDGQPQTYQRKHSFLDLSTRKHYPGSHELTLIINGVAKAQQDFMVI